MVPPEVELSATGYTTSDPPPRVRIRRLEGSFLPGALRGASGVGEDQFLELPEEGLVARRDDRAPGGPRHSPRGLEHGDTGAQVPRVGVVFIQRVEPPAGNPGEVEGKAPRAADVPHPRDHAGDDDALAGSGLGRV